MPIASSDRIVMRRGTSAEGSWGETPSTPAMTNFNVTSANLNSGKTTVLSPEIRSDRQITDIPQTGFEASGDFGFALRYAEHEWALESLFGSTFANAQTFTGAGGTDDISFEADPYNVIRGPGLEAFAVGQWISVSSAAQSGNNSRFRITGKNTNLLAVNGPLTAEDNSTATIKSDGWLKLGTTEISYLIEQEFNDITQFKYTTGARISQMSMNVNARQVVQGSFNLIAKQLFRQATTIGAASPTAASSNDIMNASTDVGSILVDFAAFSTPIQSLTLNMNGNLRALAQIGSQANAAIADGTFNIDGSLNVYFENATVYQYVLNHTTIALSFETFDAAGNRYVWTLPKLKVTGDPNAGGQNQDIVLPLQFQAFREALTGTMIHIDKFAA